MTNIRPYLPDDHALVRSLFVLVNRELAPMHLRLDFEDHIARCLVEEIDRIPDYYAQRSGGFWVAEQTSESESKILGMFGLERVQSNAAELRRMYVASDARRQGLGRNMLARAEAEAVRFGCRRMVLSTSELQQPAISFYRAAGYRVFHEEVANQTDSTKTVGTGIRRYHFEKVLAC